MLFQIYCLSFLPRTYTPDLLGFPSLAFQLHVISSSYLNVKQLSCSLSSLKHSKLKKKIIKKCSNYLLVVFLQHLSMKSGPEGKKWLIRVGSEMKASISPVISAWQEEKGAVSETHLESTPGSSVLWAVSEPEVAAMSSLSYEWCLGPTEIPQKLILQPLKLDQYIPRLSQMSVYYILSISLWKCKMKWEGNVLKQVSTTDLFSNFSRRLD